VGGVVSRVVVVPKLSSPRCRVCSSVNRERFDEYLSKMLNGEEVEGRTLTWSRMEELSVVLVGERVGERSLRRHLTDHSLQVAEEEAGELEAGQGDEDKDRAGLLAEIDALLDGGGMVSPTGVMGLHLRAHLLDLRRRVERGEEIKLTPDQAQRAANALVSAQKRSEEASLLQALTGGLGQVFSKALGPAPVGELEAGEVIGEVVGEETDGEDQ
jgi:antitoxin (DNA-binding transcriptional repressor) of toxin-antitoxin stability system